MKKTQTSTTAMGIAAMRAIESEKPQNERICYDPFARQLTTDGFYLLSKWFSAYGERKAPGTQGFILCRCRYFDDFLLDRINSGINQLVVLGAGLDSRAYRDEIRKTGIRVFEVDQPATQANKIKRLQRIMKEIPETVVYVPIDFNNETLDKLISCGYDRSLKSLFVWEGVTYYLNAGAVDATLAWMCSNAAAGSAVIFDYLYTSALAAKNKRGEIKRMQRYQRFTGEGLVFGIEKGSVVQFLTQRGFTNVVDINSYELENLYCTGANRGRPVAEVYGIVHAEIG